MIPMYIFGLDGTLALTDHRQHLIHPPPCPHCGWDKECDHSRDGTRPAFTPDWTAFFKACVGDTPNYPVIDVLHMLVQAGNHVLIWTGRSNIVQAETMKWINDYIGIGGIPMRMRNADDHRPDHELKLEWLYKVPPVERRRIVAAFEDRQRVVDMWRANGITCFQVAAGDF